MSRKGEEDVELSAISKPLWVDHTSVVEEVKADGELQKIIADLKQDPNAHNFITLEQERLHYNGCLVLASKSKWIPTLFNEFHTTPTGVTLEFIELLGGLHSPCIGKG